MNENNEMPPAVNLHVYEWGWVRFLLFRVVMCLLCILVGVLLKWGLDSMFGFALSELYISDFISNVPLVFFGFCGIAALLLPGDNYPRTFREFIEDAYGFKCASLPERKPKNGSRLFIGWWKPGDSGRGWLTVKDNKAVIETWDGRYLEPFEPDKTLNTKEDK